MVTYLYIYAWKAKKSRLNWLFTLPYIFWAAWYNTWSLIKLMLKGVVFSFSYLFYIYALFGSQALHCVLCGVKFVVTT